MKAITIFVILFGLIPLLFFLYTHKKSKDGIVYLAPYLVVVFIASVYEFVGTLLLKINVEYWFVVYKILAFVSLHYFFYHILNKRYKKLFILFFIVFVCFLFLTLTLWKGYNFLDISSYFNSLQTVIIFTFSILWFRRVFVTLEVETFTNSPIFYVISGLILCYSGSIFLFLLGNLLYLNCKSSYDYYWMLNVFLNLLLRTLLIIGIWKGQTK